jgi:limonene 1,2-monooxygenase
VVVPIHLADSRTEAIEDIREGYARRAYLGDRLAPLPPEALTDNVAPGGPATIEEALERGAVIVGTPDDAVAQVESILERSGGLGGVLGLAHEWASTPKTLHSYELWARYVAPRFQGQLQTVVDNRDWIETNINLAFRGNAAALRRAFEDTGKEMPEEMRKQIEAMRRRREQANASPAGGS